MFLFLTLWASYYPPRYDADDDNDYNKASYGNYGDGDSDDDGDVYLSTDSSYRSSSDSYSKSEKIYAKGKIPRTIEGHLSDIFSTYEIRRILGIPNHVVDLRQWKVSNLADHLSDRKQKALKDASESLDRSLQNDEAVPTLSDTDKDLIQKVVKETFREKQAVVLAQLLKLIQTTIKDEKSKLAQLEKKKTTLKQQGPRIKRQILENRKLTREAERKLDKEIKTLENRIEANGYTDQEDKKYDKEALSDLREQKSLLLVDPQRMQHDLDKQTQKLGKLKKQTELIRSDIEKFGNMSEELSEIIGKHEGKTSDLQEVWNKINHHFEKREEAKKKDQIRKEEEKKKQQEKEAKEENEEKQEQASELGFIKKIGEKSADPETEKKASGLFDVFSNFLNLAK